MIEEFTIIFVSMCKMSLMISLILIVFFPKQNCYLCFDVLSISCSNFAHVLELELFNVFLGSKHHIQVIGHADGGGDHLTP